MIRSIAAFLALIFAGAASAQEFSPDGPWVHPRLVSDRQAVAPGETFHIALHQDIAPGWHTYWLNPGDSGEPTRLDLTLPEGWTAGEMTWPAPGAYSLGPLTNYGYSDAVTLPVQVTVPEDAAPGPVEIPAYGSWLVCEDICVPEDGEFLLTLEVGESRRDADGAALISAAFEAAPEAPGALQAGLERGPDSLVLTLAGDVLAGGSDGVRALSFFPFNGSIIDHAAEQRVALGEGEARLDLRPGRLTRQSVNEAYGGVIRFDMRQDGAWRTRAIEIEAAPGESVNDLAPAAAAPAASSPPRDSASGGAAGQANGAGFSFWQAAVFALVGGLILNLMPCVFPVLSMKALTLVEKRGIERSEGRLLGLIFAAGVIVTFLALGAVFLAVRAAGGDAAWGMQLQSPGVVAGLALLMFLIGLNFLGAFEIGTSLQSVGSGVRDSGRRGAFLTGVLAVFVAAPCIAPFMAGALAYALTQPPHVALAVFGFLGAGLALPFVIVAFYPGLLSFLPRPGAWMVRLRQVLAFPMFGAGIWLVWVLAAQTGPNGVLWALIMLLAAGFAAWAFTLRGALARVTALAGAVLTAGALYFTAVQPAVTAAPAASDAVWADWSPEAVEEARAEGRAVFVDFTAAWCVTCQVNKLGALSERAVVSRFNEENVALFRADFTNRDRRIADTLAQHGAAGVPLYLMYPDNGGEPDVLPPLLTGSIVIRAVERAISRQTD
ncbi:protein-disulfide reductase DsbD family protein [Alkalicaulis satelles]|uniref:protein-disulfide reductase DsbD family protein n=1 Tax=Alkalicaulis satelles TaxID=2609175 RepID=UPI001E49E600|nr:protein-disulfide reductase DsbD domain-containing protein [Alkalicaulis satelles]